MAAESEEKGRQDLKKRSNVEVKEKDVDKVKIQMAPEKSDPVLELLGKIMADTGKEGPTVNQGPKSSSDEDSVLDLKKRGKKKKKRCR